MLTDEWSDILAQAGQEPQPIPSRWQQAAVPAWCPVPLISVCEVAYTTLDRGGRSLRQPARFLRWRPDRSPEDCSLDARQSALPGGSASCSRRIQLRIGLSRPTKKGCSGTANERSRPGTAGVRSGSLEGS